MAALSMARLRPILLMEHVRMPSPAPAEASSHSPKPLVVVPISPPPDGQRVRRDARFAPPGERRTRYSLPVSLETPSVVGYRTRVPLNRDEGQAAMALLSLARPTAFVEGGPVLEQELFEEASLGILTARQSTNYRGHRQVTFGPEESKQIATRMRGLSGLEAPVLDEASHTHVVLSKPYRTPFTMLLTLVGHSQLASPFTVLGRIYRKRVNHDSDLPTIAYLQDIHLGILADGLERASVIASGGTRRANVFQRPFCGNFGKSNARHLGELERLCGLTMAERIAGWRISIVAQVGAVNEAERLEAPPALWRKLGANLMAFRSERIQPGVNQEDGAPEPYRQRQAMDVPDLLTEMAGRAAYNAFSHWTGVDRERAKELLLNERVDVLTPNGKQRLRDIRQHLNDVTDRVIRDLPVWADLPTGKLFSKNANRGRKAFGLAGQRIYICGLVRAEIDQAGVPWELALRAVGAAASRAGLVAELNGVVDLPNDCDLLAGICLMAGPVNQNDIGKTYYGAPDLLEGMYPGRNATSLLVWTMKAKTVADPIGNEEQLMSTAQKGALVELRPGPHEVVSISKPAGREPMRRRGDRTNQERAFGDLGNFVTDPEGRAIPGNRGAEWPEAWRNEQVW